ncbi:hypothetical protein CDL15_Pgr000363 [Punica granatum]|uniref:Uncharacterized protein n=1 Tax=Punica granatum TaxID=22663 RepID=A0A218XTG3_PUNGR|nr:hypothetical protein CDL15_Pgr000363 [Punica granatum]PKI32766.1 hypothetical protein CRG98_046840 [Punica granatum]
MKVRFFQMTPYDGKSDPNDHICRHIILLLGRTFDERVKCLLFLKTLTGGSRATREKYKDVNYLFSMEQRQGEVLRAWYEHFLGMNTSLEGLQRYQRSPCMKPYLDSKRMQAGRFQEGPHRTLRSRPRRPLCEGQEIHDLKESLAAEKKCNDRLGEKRKDPSKDKRCQGKRPE